MTDARAREKEFLTDEEAKVAESHTNDCTLLSFVFFFRNDSDVMLTVLLEIMIFKY